MPFHQRLGKLARQTQRLLLFDERPVRRLLGGDFSKGTLASAAFETATLLPALKLGKVAKLAKAAKEGRFAFRAASSLIAHGGEARLAKEVAFLRSLGKSPSLAERAVQAAEISARRVQKIQGRANKTLIAAARSVLRSQEPLVIGRGSIGRLYGTAGRRRRQAASVTKNLADLLKTTITGSAAVRPLGELGAAEKALQVTIPRFGHGAVLGKRFGPKLDIRATEGFLMNIHKINERFQVDSVLGLPLPSAYEKAARFGELPRFRMVHPALQGYGVGIKGGGFSLTTDKRFFSFGQLKKLKKLIPDRPSPN